MKSNNVALVMFVCLLALVFTPVQTEACFTIAAGKEATQDGSVLFGHNEDESKATATWMHVAPREGETWACLWFEMPGIEFSDHYMNEWGVTIASNMCGSKEANSAYLDMVGNGIGRQLRQLVAERAKTAREGVLLIGKLVEEIGYNFPGRTYTIADPQEVWLCAVTGGRHWAAQRVPDDEVAVLSNRFNIREMDLGDTLNFLACPDLISYAKSRGWYNPRQPFDFGKVYGWSVFQDNDFNTVCQAMALWLLSGKNYSKDDLPFSVKPKSKLKPQDIMQALRNHFENTRYASQSSHSGSPRAICNEITQESFVAQLRANMPAFLGNVWWRAQGRLCESVFVPWYSGILTIPAPYESGSRGGSVFDVFDGLCVLVDYDFSARQFLARSVWDEFESREFIAQPEIEATTLQIYKNQGETAARQFITEYTDSLATTAYQQAITLTERFELQ